MSSATTKTCPVDSLISKMEAASGVKFHEAQVALARLWIGNTNDGSEDVPTKVAIKKPEASGEGMVISKDTKTEIEEVEMPATVEEARNIIERFERGAEGLRGDEVVSDSVAHHMLSGQASLENEVWLGTEEEEKAA